MSGFLAPQPEPKPRWRRITRRVVTWGATAALIGAVGLLGFLAWSTRRPFPTIDGTLGVPGLDAPVDVVRDGQGIPHIYAETARDLFAAQGFVHAQDRFWQMDSWRHIGSGRLSEMFGADQVETDAFIRAMGWYELAGAQYDALPPEERGYLDAYAEGVNAYLDTRSPAELGFEYTILEFINHAYTPEPWSPVDTLVWGKVMAWDLRGNMDNEIDRALLLGELTADEVHLLYPAYPDEAPVIVPTGSERTRGPGIEPPPITGRTTALRRAAANVDLLDAMTGGWSDGIGSNSWVISGDKTTTGTPLLANDPHLGIRMPSIWHQIGLHCAEPGAACPFDVAGFSFPGVPGVIIGHNATIAWGFTNLGPDVMDLYIERVNPADPDQYEVDGGWVDMTVRNEVISVAGGEDVEVEVRATRHGPVISDVFDRFDEFDAAGVELPDDYVVALRWTALEEVPSLTSTVMGLNRASNWDEFRAALASFSVPAQNVVYADTSGNIGYQAPGLVPVRAAGDGRIPVPGWDDAYEWVGFIPYDELPSVLNPPAGWIAAANNAVVDGGYPHLLTTDWNLGDRARRIVEMIESRETFSVDDVAAMQFDNRSLAAERIRPLFLAMSTAGLTPLEQEAMAELADWDLANDAESAGAAIFEVAWTTLLGRALDDDVPADIEPNGGVRWSLAIESLAASPGSRLWDDRTTDAVEDRDDIVEASFVAAVAVIADRLGNEVAEWQWGDLHTATFENETLGRSGIGLIEAQFNRGPYATSGGLDIVNATGWTPAEGFAVDWVPSMRMIVDLGDLDASRWVNTTGASGHTHHEHYDDQIARWRIGNSYPWPWSRNAVEAAAEGTLRLIPESR